jgi:hypothetical protein
MILHYEMRLDNILKSNIYLRTVAKYIVGDYYIYIVFLRSVSNSCVFDILR